MLKRRRLKKQRRFRSGGPRERTLKYPFTVLDNWQKPFLRALGRAETQTIGQAFGFAWIRWINARNVLQNWLDDVAFEEALFITLRSMARVRRDQVFDTICAFLRREPIHKICNVPRPRAKQNNGWNSHRFASATGRRRKQFSPTFSESGEDPWK